MGGTFHAELSVRTAAGLQRVGSRSSDAIALALRVDCPIEVADDVIDLAGLRPDDGDGADATDEELDDGMVEAFREFIENVDPEDFLG